MKTRYLVPLDGSKLGEQALPWARLLGRAFLREVELLSCYEPVSTVYQFPDFEGPAPVTYDQSVMDQQIERYLQTQKETLSGVPVRKNSREGDPATVILERAESGEIEAIVMSSHGRGGIGRWLMGSVATKILRGSRIPVLLINSSTTVDPKPEIKKILVPLDGSALSEAAIPRAIEIAKDSDATVLLYRALTSPTLGGDHFGQELASELENIEDYLNGWKEKYPKVQLETRVKVTGPRAGIEEAAEECDLVVISSHGRSGLKRWVLGSVTEGLLQSIRTPMMVVYS